MSSSSFLINPSAGLIADASVVINLNATARAADIIRAVANPFFVTENALEELKSGSHKGHRDHSQLLELIDAGLVRRAPLGVLGLPVYESMIDGSTLQTLDDGEAATIAFAQELSGIALIDERKARTLCRRSFPHLEIASTVELLMHDAVATAIGSDGQIDALMNALTNARMRVPAEHMEQLTRVIGVERAASCSSLPKHIRERDPVERIRN
jgi:predicted nucleic acid-binding protein